MQIENKQTKGKKKRKKKMHFLTLFTSMIKELHASALKGPLAQLPLNIHTDKKKNNKTKKKEGLELLKKKKKSNITGIKCRFMLYATQFRKLYY